MFFVIFLVLILGVILHYVLTWKRFLEFSKAGVPWKIGYPLVYRFPKLLSMLADNTRSPLEGFLDEMKDAKNGLYAFKRSMLTPPMMVSANPEVNKYILERPDKYDKGKFLTTSLEPLLGDGIFNTNGQRWLDQRKHAAFMFAKREVKKMGEIFLAHFEFMKKRLNKGEPVEMQGNPTFHLLSTTRCQRLILLWLLFAFRFG